MVASAREHELTTQIDALVGLAIVSVLRGDLTLARSCRDELRSHQHGTQSAEIERTLARLACAFVDLADGDADRAAEAGAEVLADAERQNIPWPRCSASNSLPRASLATTRNAQGIFSRRPAESACNRRDRVAGRTVPGRRLTHARSPRARQANQPTVTNLTARYRERTTGFEPATLTLAT